VQGLNYNIKLFIIGRVFLFGLVKFLTKISYMMMFLTNTPPIPIPEVSYFTLNTLVKSGNHIIRAFVIFFLTSANALLAHLFYWNSSYYETICDKRYDGATSLDETMIESRKLKKNMNLMNILRFRLIYNRLYFLNSLTWHYKA